MKAKRGNEETYSSPYMHDLLPETSGTRRAFKMTIDFIGDMELGKTLDIGVPNPLGKLLEKHYKIKIENTNIDLDLEELTGEYDSIFCFEVIEHLFNPLHFLLQVRKILKDNGRLYITTPKCKPYFLWSEVHFHEFHKPELMSLLKKAGLRVVRFKSVKIRPFWWYFIGFRPMLRFIFERRFLIELKK